MFNINYYFLLENENEGRVGEKKHKVSVNTKENTENVDLNYIRFNFDKIKNYSKYFPKNNADKVVSEINRIIYRKLKKKKSSFIS